MHEPTGLSSFVTIPTVAHVAAVILLAAGAFAQSADSISLQCIVPAIEPGKQNPVFPMSTPIGKSKSISNEVNGGSLGHRVSDFGKEISQGRCCGVRRSPSTGGRQSLIDQDETAEVPTIPTAPNQAGSSGRKVTLLD